jgi:hypothetical protein
LKFRGTRKHHSDTLNRLDNDSTRRKKDESKQ